MQTPDETLRTRHRLLPRQRLAAGQPAAPVRPGRPLRLRLPRPARRRPKVPRRAQRARPRTSPTCTPGPRCSSPAPAGSAWTRPAACSPARATSRSAPPRTPAPPPRSRAPPSPPRSTSASTTRCAGSTRTRGSPSPTPTPRGRASTPSARPVDERLVAGDVRLTMGGEPTFVSLDDATSDQWNTDADGPEKRQLAGRPRRAAARRPTPRAASSTAARASGTPASRCPRWNIALQWRTDGVPLWQDPALFADPWDDAGPARRRRGPRRGAEALARRVTAALGLPAEQLLRGVRGPVRRARRRGPAARRCAARDRRRPTGCRRRASSSHGSTPTSTAPTGWVLPLVTGEEWTSPAWRFRRGRLVLGAGHQRRRACGCRWTRSPGRTPSRRRAVLPRGRPAAGPVGADRRRSSTRRSAHHRAGLRGARRPRPRLPAADRAARGLRRPAPAGRGRHPPDRLPIVLEGYGPPPDAAAHPARRSPPTPA